MANTQSRDGEKKGEKKNVSWCLMLIRLNDMYRHDVSKLLPVITTIRGEYMSLYPAFRSWPNGEGALAGPYDFYLLFEYDSDGPTWLASRIQSEGVAAEVVTMQVMELDRFVEFHTRIASSAKPAVQG